MAGSRPVQRRNGILRGERNKVTAMTIELFAFFVIAALLVLIGFASGPVAARNVVPSRRIRR